MSLAAAVATVHSNPSAMLNHCRHSFLGVDEKAEYREDRKKVDKKGHYPQYISVDVILSNWNVLRCFQVDPFYTIITNFVESFKNKFHLKNENNSLKVH